MTKFIPPPNDKRKRGGGDDDEDGAAADDEDADLSKVSFFLSPLCSGKYHRVLVMQYFSCEFLKAGFHVPKLFKLFTGLL